MKKPKTHQLALLVAALALNADAQPVLVYSEHQAFASAGLSNLRVHDQSPDKTELILTVDFAYDGVNGTTVHIVPVISDKKHPKVDQWFGANPVSVGVGRGTVSLRVKFFSDEPGAPRQVSTDHVKILMLTDAGNTIVNSGIFARDINWGTPGPAPAKAPLASAPSQTKVPAEKDSKATPPVTAVQPAPSKASDGQIKSKVANVEVAHRNFDRTEIIVSVEYQYENRDRTRKMGIELLSAGEKSASSMFTSPTVDLSHGSRGVAFFPVKLDPLASRTLKHPTLRTDKVRVYLVDADGAKVYIHESVMPVVWNITNDGLAGAKSPPAG